ncbi:toprim domain-containing protein [Pedobacter jamesrossensis]|uniref:Toprim domain-containing protein n=1 Tax=Pedobacter jamesrossensis TaxID=1908238 RepID=A0ABV8NL68_9SPHI
MNIQEAKNQIHILDYLSQKGIFPVKKCCNDHWFKGVYREENTPSLKVNASLNRWYDHGTGTGGNIIDLALKLGNLTVKDALADILNTKENSFSFQAQQSDLTVENNTKVSNLIILREQGLQNRALLQYAAERGITENIAKKYCVEVYYKIISSGKYFFSIAFKNDLGGYALRNKYFKNASSPAGVTSIGFDKPKVKVFEGFFDFLSFKMLSNTNDYDAIILNSLAHINQVEESLLNYDSIELYLDNDTSSKNLKSKLRRRYESVVVDKSDGYSDFKDLNEMLISTRGI